MKNLLGNGLSSKIKISPKTLQVFDKVSKNTAGIDQDPRTWIWMTVMTVFTHFLRPAVHVRNKFTKKKLSNKRTNQKLQKQSYQQSTVTNFIQKKTEKSLSKAKPETLEPRKSRKFEDVDLDALIREFISLVKEYNEIPKFPRLKPEKNPSLQFRQTVW